MVKMDKTHLNKAIKEFKKVGDIETAKHFIITYGSQIKDYDVTKELAKLEDKPKKDSKKNK